METDTWLTPDELAKYLEVSRTKLYRMAQEVKIPGSKIGAQWRFNRHEIDNWVTNQRTGGVASQGNENGNDGEGA